MKNSLLRAEVRPLLGLLLLGMMPVGYAYYISLKEEAQQKALTKYTDTAVVGHSSYVRLNYGYPTNGEAEGAYGDSLCRPKPDIWNSFYKIPRERWKIVFVEDLPNLIGKKNHRCPRHNTAGNTVESRMRGNPTHAYPRR